jgi:preprotein translocase subunit SecG
VKNDLSETVIQSGDKLILVNPTNKIKVYKIIPESPATVSENVVVVPADSSRSISVNANSGKEYKVSVFSGETLVKTVTFNTATDEKSTSTASPLVILTVILAIIFVILLVVLIVLITKKPEKTEEFSESYY